VTKNIWGGTDLSSHDPKVEKSRGRHRIVRNISKWLVVPSLVTFLIAPYINSIPIAQAQTTTRSSPEELTAYENANTQIFLNPDGTVSSKAYFAPVNYKGQHGNWHHIDTTITSDSKGGYKVDKNSFVTQFGAAANSSNLETVNYKGKQVAFSLASTSIAGTIGSR
jgi:hypothetical protein